ncbi:bifunctional riboflavin kinase/FMN adenylyltransferase [Bombiscardovia coagulans]|uniref:Bifunctional riboflavin kinase/FMN adenylyltransferase n=1 Tax=Bombiscardovia coagulans TaxID=686666 RepID=A0A261ETV0_9BIFI|nr:riboflavin kinase [Bombiscardovia coagulans]OZG50283.1 bifunctional riboflavin kinase/FMN adenylyltransferase [Bombiscardovia coagulans]
MKISRLEPDASGIVNWPTLSTTKKCVVTVGVFDGMHRGHQAVIQRVVQLAHQQGDFAVVILFDPSPKRVHSYAASHSGAELPDQELRNHEDELMAASERIRLMKQLGVDWVLSISYNLAFAAKSFRYFIGTLVGKLGMRTLVLGRDATMGAGRSGNVQAVEELSQATGVFTLDIVDDAGPGYTWVPQIVHQQVPDGPGEPSDPLVEMSKAEMRAWTKAHACKKVRMWSSSNVRYLLASGRIHAANAVLGHTYAVEGEVVHGEKRGRELGYPTANVSQEHEGYMPVDGVYAGWLVDLGKPRQDSDSDNQSQSDNHTQTLTADPGHDVRLASGSVWRWPAAISIGTKETFASEGKQYERVLEVNAIAGDNWLDLYGHRVRVEFLSYLRPQKKYPDADALVKQLAQDAADSLRIAQESVG